MSWDGSRAPRALPHQIPGPRTDGEGHLGRQRVPGLLPGARDRGRVLRLLPKAARFLEDVRPRAARRGPEEDLLQERPTADPGHRPQRVPGVTRIEIRLHRINVCMHRFVIRLHRIMTYLHRFEIFIPRYAVSLTRIMIFVIGFEIL